MFVDDLLVEVDGIDRSGAVLRDTAITYTRNAEQGGNAKVTFTIDGRAWMPEETDTLTIWTEVRTIRDAQIDADSDVLHSESAIFESDDLSHHVRIDGAGPRGFRFAAAIIEIIDDTHVRLDQQASTTVRAALALVGEAHFTGVVSSVSERPAGDENSATLHVATTAIDIAGVCERQFPRFARPLENLRSRLDALFDLQGLSPHQALVFWTNSRDVFELEGDYELGLYGGGVLELSVGERGGLVSAATYTGQSSLLAIIRQLTVDEGHARTAYFDALGRLRVEEYASTPTAQDLDGSDLRLRGLQVNRVLQDYANRVIYFWGPAGAYVIEEDPDEIDALGGSRVLEFEGGYQVGLYGGGVLELHSSEESGRAFEHIVTDTACPDADTARARARALLDTLARRGLYTFGATTEVRVEPCQVGPLTLVPLGAVGGDHLIQNVSARYLLDAADPFFEYDFIATNNTRPILSAVPTQFWRSIDGTAA